jgi:hypothetical protein
MATRSRIGIENQDGTVTSIYCHWDGGPENNGAMLKEHYSDRERVEKLIALGSLSSLSPEIDPTGEHSFEKPQVGVTVAYHRDRGEDLIQSIKPSTERYFEDVGNGWEGYGYLFTKQGEWVYSKAGRIGHVKL